MRKLDLFAGLLVTTMWGCNFSVIELGLQDLDPFILTLLRFAFCAFPLVFFIRPPTGVSLFHLGLYGVLFGAGLWWVVSFAMYSGLSAGMSAVFLQFSVFFTIILSWALLKEQINKIQGLGMLVSLIGLLLIIYFSHKESTVRGVLLVMTAAFSWALCNLIVKVSQPAKMIPFIVWSSLFSTPAILILTLAVKGVDPVVAIPENMTWAAAFSVLFQAYITTIVGYRVWNNLMKKYPSSTVAPLSLLIPISGIISSYVFLDERMSAYQLMSIVIVIVGVSIFLSSNKISAVVARRAHPVK